jgi:hypothetical protein
MTFSRISDGFNRHRGLVYPIWEMIFTGVGKTFEILGLSIRFGKLF